MKLRHRLIGLFLAVVLIPLVFVNLVFFSSVEENILDLALEEKSLLLKEKSDEAILSLSEYRRDLLIIENLPPIRGIYRSSRTGIDPFDGSSLKDWEDRLSVILRKHLEVKTLISHIAYLDKEGNEIFRINEVNGVPNVMPKDELQSKAHRFYYNEAKLYDFGDVYLSPADLNVENKKIEFPYKPVVRFLTPVYNEEELVGLIQMNIRAGSIIDSLTEDSLGFTSLIDQDGYYLTNEDKSKIFTKVLGTNENYFEDHLGIRQPINSSDTGAFYDKNSDSYILWQKVYYDSTTNERYWVLINSVSSAELFGRIDNLLNLLLLISSIVLIVVGLISFAISKSISEPLDELTATIEEVSKGNLDVRVSNYVSVGNDEISNLSRSLERILISLKLAVLRKGVSMKELEIGSSDNYVKKEALSNKKPKRSNGEKSTEREEEELEKLKSLSKEPSKTESNTKNKTIQNRKKDK